MSSHWKPQPGQRPAVSKVFQTVPQRHHQRLEDRGRQAHFGQRMRGFRARGGSRRTAVGASGEGGASSVRFDSGRFKAAPGYHRAASQHAAE